MYTRSWMTIQLVVAFAAIFVSAKCFAEEKIDASQLSERLVRAFPSLKLSRPVLITKTADGSGGLFVVTPDKAEEAYAFNSLCRLRNCAVNLPEEKLPLVYEDDFEAGAENWQPTDPKAWKVKVHPGEKPAEENSVYSQHLKKSNYAPPHRSPFNISLLQEVTVTDFEYNVKVLSTHEDYNHRDCVLVFGYQDPSHFYYVHLGRRADDHANQIFIVNDAPRTKISLTSTAGTPWDQKWHQVRVVRNVKAGTIEIFFDDMNKPVMTAKDDTFTWGRIGLGTFDDTADFDQVQLFGNLKQ